MESSTVLGFYVFLVCATELNAVPHYDIDRGTPPDDSKYYTPKAFEKDILGLDADSVKNYEVHEESYHEASGKEILLSLQAPIAKNGVADENLRWKGGIIPFQFGGVYSQKSSFESSRRDLILQAMDSIQNATCIKFVQRSNEKDYIVFVAFFNLCQSYVGNNHMPEIGQPVVLSLAQCYLNDSFGIVMHELIHNIDLDCTYGGANLFCGCFYHEQARADRDEFVDINWENIQTEDRDQFQKYSDSVAFGEKYDFGSIMHYAWNDFAIDDKVWTIRAKAKFGNVEIGQRRAMSAVDIRKINSMYKCDQKQPETTPPPDLSQEPDFELPHRGCYFNHLAPTRDGLGRLSADDVNPDLCTYITVTGGRLRNGLLMLDETMDRGILTTLAGFKAQRPKQKVLISFGDADSVGLVSLAGDRHARHKFASTATRDLRQWGVDGLDILYKNDVASKGMKKADLTALIDELRRAFVVDSVSSSRTRLALAIAVYSDPSSYGIIDVSTLNTLVDIVTVVAYDLGSTATQQNVLAHHAPTVLGPIGIKQRYNMESIVQLWSTSGFSKSKMVTGLPFYGRGWLLDDAQDTDFGSPTSGYIPASQYTKQPRVWPYYEICMKIKDEGANNVFNPDIQASFAYSDAWWIGYNDQQTIRTKVKWLRTNGYGGVIALDISEDDFGNNCGDGANPLLQAIKEEWM